MIYLVLEGMLLDFRNSVLCLESFNDNENKTRDTTRFSYNALIQFELVMFLF